MAHETLRVWHVETGRTVVSIDGTVGNVIFADGDVIVAGPPWQAWRAPSWEEIAGAESKEKLPIKQP